MPLQRVIVCDDDDGTREGFVEEINSVLGNGVAVNHTAGQLKAAITALLGDGGPTLFDDADVVVIDNRLIDEWRAAEDPKVSAEQLSDLVRTSTTAKAVVVLNQYRELDFDLRLDGRLESYADLNITDKCLGVRGLWVEAPPEGFRPWIWPVLEALPGRLAKCAAWLQADGRLDNPILETLGLAEPQVTRGISRVALDFLHAEKVPVEVTFRDFVTGATRATDRKDRATLKDNDALAAKIAASRIGKWLETTITGPQDVLVDAPHLVERYPCLIAAPGELESWNAVVSWSSTEGFNSELAAPSLWPLWDTWSSRPIYVWAKAQADGVLAQALSDCYEKAPPLDVGFCEDTSRFALLDQTRDFVANFDSAFDRRRVQNPPQAGFAYGPASRFAR